MSRTVRSQTLKLCDPVMTASLRRPLLIRPLIAMVAALTLTASVTACSESASEQAAKEVGYRDGDGSVTNFEPAERDEPVELSGETIQGNTWDSKDHRGSVVVVNSWASWCGPCEKEAPHLVEAHQETKEDDVEFVGIDFREHSVETGLAQSKTWGYKWPSVYDKSGSTALDMQGKMSITPSTVVLDREGRIAIVILGATTKKTFVGAIEDIVAEQHG